MPISKTNKKKIKPQTHHATIPDLSNMIKWVEDICVGIVYKDDAIISSITSKKMYDENPRTEFFFSELKGNYGKKD
jgi:Holliday junction resolvase RusA-like endonuclease